MIAIRPVNLYPLYSMMQIVKTALPRTRNVYQLVELAVLVTSLLFSSFFCRTSCTHSF